MFRAGLIKSSAINGFGFVVASGAILSWYYLVIRVYPSNLSGALLLALAVSGAINLLDLGVTLGLTKRFSMMEPHQYISEGRAYVWTALIGGLTSQAIIGGLSLSMWVQLSDDAPPTVACFSILIFAVSTQGVLLVAGVMRGARDFKTANLISVLNSVLVYGTGSAVVLADSSIWSVFWTMSMIQSVFCIIAIGRVLVNLTGSFAISPLTDIFNTYLRIVRSSLVFYPQMFVGIFFAHIQRFLVLRYVGIDAVASTSFAYSIATRIHSIINAFVEVIFPYARQLKDSGRNIRAIIMTASAAAFIVGLVASSTAGLIIYYVMPEVLHVFLWYAVGVCFSLAAAPMFHLWNGVESPGHVSLISIVGPLIFALLVDRMDAMSDADNVLILPMAYAIAMTVGFMMIAVMCMRRLGRTSTRIKTS